MNHLDILPPGIGTKLEITNLSQQDCQITSYHSLLQNKTKYTICIDGLAGVGKSTLGSYLSSYLQIPHISSGIFYRIFAYIFYTQNLEFNQQNILRVMEQISFKIFEKRLIISYKDFQIPTKQLKTPQIDKYLNQISTDLFFRDCVTKMLVKMCISLPNSFILDLRGSSPDYVTALEAIGTTVVRLLLVTETETKVSRRMLEYKQPSQKEHDAIKQSIEERDSKDIESIKKTNIGLIHTTTGIIDTTNLKEEVVGILALNWVKKHLY
jgi:CMP/dCMP kinase